MHFLLIVYPHNFLSAVFGGIAYTLAVRISEDVSDSLFHDGDLLLRSYLYHCVWSVITAHNGSNGWQPMAGYHRRTESHSREA